ncbi:MAG: hypothetical protein IH845_00245 [Nanoarchaeota archaeon]|nr:hypothetical protein [Nanoarchaeota archaeon]
MIYKEYRIGNDGIDLCSLKASRMELEDYRVAHQNLPILCHDVFIEFDEGIIFGKRNNEPAKGMFWPIGGRLERGIPMEESLRNNARKESGLELENLEILALTRYYYPTDPFDHGKGTDTPTLVYFANGVGSMKRDSQHETLITISREEYLRGNYKLDQFNTDMMDEIIRRGLI